MFCKICGKELNDNAVICPGCGCAVNNNLKPVAEETKVEPIKSEENKAKNPIFTTHSVMQYVTMVLICFAVTFLFLALISIGIDVDVFETRYDILAWGDLYFYFEYAIPCFVFTILSYISALFTFILGFNSANKYKRFSSNTLFIIVQFLLFIAILLFIFSR